MSETTVRRDLMRPVHGFAGAAWLKQNLAYSKGKPAPSLFGELVADLLGYVYAGLYHLPSSAINRAEWDSTRYIVVSVPSGVATWDGGQLTNLVLLAHACSVRVEISQGGPYRLQFHFSPRDRDGSIGRGHPSIELAVAWLNERVTFKPLHADLSEGSR